jgi:hypothetical protein
MGSLPHWARKCILLIMKLLKNSTVLCMNVCGFSQFDKQELIERIISLEIIDYEMCFMNMAVESETVCR